MKYSIKNANIISRNKFYKILCQFFNVPNFFPHLPTTNTELVENLMIFADKLEYVQLYLDLDYRVIVKEGTKYILLQKQFAIRKTNTLTNFKTCNKQDRHNFFHFNRNRRLHYMQPIYTPVYFSE